MKLICTIDTLVDALQRHPKRDGYWQIRQRNEGPIMALKYSRDTVGYKLFLIPPPPTKPTKTIMQGISGIPQEAPDGKWEGKVHLTPKDTSVWTTDTNKVTEEIEVAIARDKLPSESLRAVWWDGDPPFDFMESAVMRDGFLGHVELLTGINLCDQTAKSNSSLYRSLVLSPEQSSDTGEWIDYRRMQSEAMTQLNNVTFSVGRNGAIIPVITFEPINFYGVLVSQATTHNTEQFSKYKMCTGDLLTVKVSRKGQQAVTVSDVTSTGDSGEIVPPVNCPACSKKLLSIEGKRGLYCVNRLCVGRVTKAINHWCAKENMGIRGMGGRLAGHLVGEGIITSPADIYTLRTQDLQSIKGIREKGIQNLLERISESRFRKLSSVIHALGIEYIGQRTASVLAWYFITLKQFLNPTKPMTEVLGILLRSNQRQSISSFLDDDFNREVLNRLCSELQPTIATVCNEKHPFVNKRILIWGDFPGFDRVTIETLLRQAAIVSVKTGDEYDWLLVAHDNKSAREKALADNRNYVKISRLLADVVCS